jgi:flagellar basal-body rod protein FlgC
MKIDRMFAGLNISSMGMTAQRKRMNAIASNMANAETTKTEDGGPYQRKVISLRAAASRSFASLMTAVGSPLATTDERHFETGLEPTGTSTAIPAGVDAAEQKDPSAFRMVYDPSHPDADKDGYVKMPNVNVVTEMVDMISATRSYEANVTAVGATKQMSRDALEI